MSAATSTLETNDTTNCLSSKMPSSLARIPPNTASSAATTAIGRYGWRTSGTDGSKIAPSTTPTSSATSANTQCPPGDDGTGVPGEPAGGFVGDPLEVPVEHHAQLLPGRLAGHRVHRRGGVAEPHDRTGSAHLPGTGGQLQPIDGTRVGTGGGQAGAALLGHLVA